MPEIADITPTPQQATDALLVRRGAATPHTLELLERDQVADMLPLFNDTTKGLTPASGGGTANFMRADGTWAAPPKPTVQDEGVSLTTAMDSVNVVGRGARATGTSAVTLTVDGVIIGVPSSDQHNWAPAGLDAGTGLIKLQPTTNSFITGITAGAADQKLELVNDSTFLICIERESSASTAANRIGQNGLRSLWLLPGETVRLRYCSTQTRWLVTDLSKNAYLPGPTSNLFLPNVSNSMFAFGLGTSAVTATVSTTSPTGAANEFEEYGFSSGTNSTAAGTSSVRMQATYFLRSSDTVYRGFFHTGAVRFTALGATGAVRAGLLSTTTVSTILNASQVNCLILGADGGMTTLRIFHNDAAGVSTQIDLGANFPTPSATAAYEYAFYAPPGQTFVRYMVRRLDTRFVAEGTLTTDLPVNTTALGHRIEAMVGGTGAANTWQCARLLTLGL